MNNSCIKSQKFPRNVQYRRISTIYYIIVHLAAYLQNSTWTRCVYAHIISFYRLIRSTVLYSFRFHLTSIKKFASRSIQDQVAHANCNFCVAKSQSTSHTPESAILNSRATAVLLNSHTSTFLQNHMSNGVNYIWQRQSRY